MDHAIDAGPMIALLSDETGSDIVERILLENPGECYAHVLNLAEVYYVTIRRNGKAAAEKALERLFDAGIISRSDSDDDFWKAAATFKANHPFALPDGFCLALAQRLNATVVTTDHAEFDPLIPIGYCPILFIR